MELNTEQIKKAVDELRKHGLNNGGTLGYHAGWCDDVADTIENVLPLITSQEQRIKELETENTQFRHEQEELTVRKMQERLKAEMRNTAKYSFGRREYSVIGEEFIDQIAKEMLEGEK